MYKDVHQYCHFMYNYKFTLQIFEKKAKKIRRNYTLLSDIFAVFNTFWIRTAMLVIGAMLEQIFFRYSRFRLFSRQYYN